MLLHIITFTKQNLRDHMLCLTNSSQLETDCECASTARSQIYCFAEVSLKASKEAYRPARLQPSMLTPHPLLLSSEFTLHSPQPRPAPVALGNARCRCQALRIAASKLAHNRMLRFREPQKPAPHTQIS